MLRNKKSNLFSLLTNRAVEMSIFEARSFDYFNFLVRQDGRREMIERRKAASCSLKQLKVAKNNHMKKKINLANVA